MPGTYVEITEIEFDEFMGSLGFREMVVSGVKEKVYGKVIRHENHRFSVRIYSTIQFGKSRHVGSDAIRVEVYTQIYKQKGFEVVRVGGSKRVNRVGDWKKRIIERIKGWKSCFGPTCTECNHVMVVKVPKPNQHWKPFMGCINYPACKNTKSIEKKK